MNLASRALLLWLLIYILMSNITNLTTYEKLLISTMVILIFTLIEYIILQVNPPSMCTLLCGYELDNQTNANQYVEEAIKQLKLQEHSDAPIEP